MLKKLIFAVMAAACCMTAGAQTLAGTATTRTISGMVVDKNGNPLPGAEVRATGGAETVYAEADGSFTMEVPITLKSVTASYTGLKDTKVKTPVGNDRMLFTLKPFKKTHGFLDICLGGQTILNSYPEGATLTQVSLMGGVYRTWGFYGKFSVAFSADGDYDGDDACTGIWTLGVIRKITDNLNVFLGVGIGGNVGWDYYQNDYSYDYYYDYSYKYWEYSAAPAFEVGVMYHVKKLNLVAGVNYMPQCDKWVDGNYYWQDNSGNLSFFAGVGLNF